MKYIKEYAFSALAILMASCSSDSDTIEPEAQKTPVTSSGTMSFSASIESGETASKATRTSLADANTTSPYPIWSSGDQIKVYNIATNDAQLFTINSSDVGKRAANFTGNIKVETGNNANNKFYAFYAGNVGASEGAPTISMSGSNVTVSGTIPSTQSSTPGFHSDLHFMTACTTGSAFSFKNAMALMAVTIDNNSYSNFQITKIILKSNNPDEKIAGDFTATIGDNGTLSNYSVTNGSSEIVIDNGTSALATGTYYIAINPCAFSSGFTLSFHENSADGNLKQYDRVKDTSFPVAASEIINLGSYTGKECAKEAYVDLGLPDGTLWCVENIYDDNANSLVDNSYYSWGETLVKANQTKEQDYLQTYSWYYQYYVNQTSSSSGSEKNRAYLLGVGTSNYNPLTHGESYEFKTTSNSGKLLKYNSYDDYNRTAGDPSTVTPDNKTVLETVDDAAYQKSTKLRMPSADNFQTLMNNADNETESNKILICGPSGGNTLYKFKNRETGHYIVLPLKGYRYQSSSDGNDDPQNSGNWACYWTRDRASAAVDSYMAKAAIIKREYKSGKGERWDNITDIDRAAGLMIRAIINK